MTRLGETLLDYVVVDGVEYKVKTDYRDWIKLPGMKDYRELFVDKNPSFNGYFSKNAIKAIKEFYLFGNEPSSEQQEPLMDFEQDAGKIYASFMQVYKIDLFDSKIHWHKFLMLLQNLPEWTSLSKIMAIRAYEGEDEELNRLKNDYALERDLTESEESAGNYFEELFG